MKRPWHIWAAYVVGLLVLAGGMGWVTTVALDLDRARIEAQRQAEFEEEVRLALWRLDSRAAVLVGRETARPYAAYVANSQAQPPQQGGNGEQVLLYFRVSPEGRVTSPQVPAPSVPQQVSQEEGSQWQQQTAQRAGFLSHSVRASLLSDLERSLGRAELSAAIPAEPREVRLLAEANRVKPQPTAFQGKQATKSQAEYRARSFQTFVGQSHSNLAAQEATRPLGPVEPRLEPMYPFWHGERLLLARRVVLNDGEHFQGCVLDWPAVRGWLLEAVADLLPDAGLAPVPPGDDAEPGRRLASLPVRLVAGTPPDGPSPGWTPIRVALAVAWSCVLASALSAGLLLGTAVSLSERRAAFVSAVTHELRTPLTTFRMYTEMLDEGMLPDEDTRREYVSVLHREAERLSHLVENVLAFARLERGRAAAKTEVLGVTDLLERLASALDRQATRCGMELAVEGGDAAAGVRVSADPSAVEQIMSNLIDNACKYARDADDRTVKLQAAFDGRTALLTVRDYGPGIARSEARRIFRPFRKSARDAAHSAPGVGLGLALSRELARSMGGDLRLANPGKPGACFVLSLPRS